MQPRPHCRHRTPDRTADPARPNKISGAGPLTASCGCIKMTLQAASWHPAWKWTSTCPKDLESCLWFLMIKYADEIPHHAARENLSFLCQLPGITVKPFPNHLFMHEGELECTCISERCTKWASRYGSLIAPRLHGRRMYQIRVLYLLPVLKFKPIVRIHSREKDYFWSCFFCNL